MGRARRRLLLRMPACAQARYCIPTESSSGDRRRGPEPVDDRTSGRMQQSASRRAMHGSVALRSSPPATAECSYIAIAIAQGPGHRTRMRSSRRPGRRDRMRGIAVARPERARERKRSCRSRPAHAWIWAGATVPRRPRWRLLANGSRRVVAQTALMLPLAKRDCDRERRA
jgi:hypothetical protein